MDFLDQHDYGDLPNVTLLEQMFKDTGKPIILGEFSFTAADSNMPNTRGARAGHPERTQTRRAEKYLAFATEVAKAPFMLGYGWWNAFDEPSTGRWPDGECSNYGIFSLAGDIYTTLAAAMTKFHAGAGALHEAA